MLQGDGKLEDRAIFRPQNRRLGQESCQLNDRERNMNTQPRKHTGHTGQADGKHGIPVALQTGQQLSGKTASLEQALADALLENGEQEFDCMLLFEFPATMLVGGPAGGLEESDERAAACLCQFGGKARAIFITTSADGHSVRLFEEAEVSRELAELSWSYARILSFMPGTLARQEHPAIN